MAGRGYVKLHREAMDHAVFHDEWLWKVFCWCVMKANFRTFVGQRQTVPRGSFTTGRNRAGDELNASPSRVYRAFERLQGLGCIQVSPNNNWTTITVCNYETYNSMEDDDRTTDEQPANNERTTDEQRTNTIEETKKLRSQEVNTPVAPIPPELSREPFNAAWADWLLYRKERRLSTRTRTIAAQLTSLAPLGPDAAAECLRLSIRNGWQGIFPERMNLNGSNKQPAHVGPGQRYRGD